MKNFATHVLSDVSRCSCQASFTVPFSIKIGTVQQVLTKRPKIKFQENSLSGSRISKQRRADVYTDRRVKASGCIFDDSLPLQRSVNINTYTGIGL
jgi:hypothetical protein